MANYEDHEEHRFVYGAAAPEIRSSDGKSVIAGYASVFNKRSRNLGSFIETVDNRAFDTSKSQGWPGAIARFNHDDRMLLGTVQGKTLTLWTDATGLAYEVDPPATRADVVELIQRGDVTSSSFAFRTISDDWGMSADAPYPHRTLLEVELIDVAPVTTPAYPDATAALRATNGAIESLAKRFDASPEEMRSLLDRGDGVKLFKQTGVLLPGKKKEVRKLNEDVLAKYRQLKSELNGKRFDPYIGEGDSSPASTTAPKFDMATREGRMRALEFQNARKTDATAYCPNGQTAKKLGGTSEEDWNDSHTGIAMSGKAAAEYENKHASRVKRIGGTE